MNQKLQEVIKQLEDMPKHGESYDDRGRHGWRNPIRSDTGIILMALVRAKGAKRILEVGTAHGLSACYLGANGAEIVTIEWDEAVAKRSQETLDEAGINAQVVAGDAMKVIPTLTGKFDLVFLDANKDGYAEQTKLIQESGLLEDGALILADNVLDREEEMKDFHELMAGKSEIVNTECGLLVGNL